MPDDTATVLDLEAIRSAAKAAAEDCFKPDPVAEIIAEFNNLYMMVNEGGRAIIFQPGYDPVLKRRRFDRLSVRDLQTLYMNKLIKIGADKDGNSIFKGAADIWLRHKDRRQYIHGVTFDPTSKPQPGVLNLWEGFAVKPEPGDWSLLREHVLQVICAGDTIRFNYLMKYIARMFQRPAEAGEVAVVMKGVEGCGKGTLAKAILRITGHHGLAISNAKHLIGNFNAHLRDVIFLFADEALFAGDRSHVGTLKSLITEPYLTIEGKYINAMQAPNFLHVMMASNESWVVPASLEARRFLVLDVLDTHVKDFAYFRALAQQMEAGGHAAMLHDMLVLDLTGFDVRDVPTTEGLQQQRKLSLGTTEAWWLDCLERGFVFQSRLGIDDQVSIWMSSISTQLLALSYAEFAKSRGERRPLSREALGAFFKANLQATPVRLRNAIAGEALMDVDNIHGGTSRKAKPIRHPRPPGYVVGDLEQAREAFIHYTGLRMEWDGGAPDEAAAPHGPDHASSDVSLNQAEDPFGETVFH